MFLFRKNIILVPSDYDGVCLSKGLINFDCYDGYAECTLRCYNLDIDKPLTFGVAINGELNKFEVTTNKLKCFEFKLPITIKNNDEISCVLLDIGRNAYSIVLWGSTQINNAWKSTLKMMLEAEDELYHASYKSEQNDFASEKGKQQIDQMQKNETKPIEEIQKYNEIDLNENLGYDSQNQIERHIKTETEQENKSTIQSSVSPEEDKLEKFIDRVIELTEENDKDISISQTQAEDQIVQPIFSNVKQNDQKTFYERIYPQIEKMFEVNKSENVLEEIIPNSKFCKVAFDDGAGYYVFGIIYDDEMPKYLCYGLPAQKQDKPPREMSSLYQWFPIDMNDISGDGFYMMYQDASTGQNISVDVIWYEF